MKNLVSLLMLGLVAQATAMRNGTMDIAQIEIFAPTTALLDSTVPVICIDVDQKNEYHIKPSEYDVMDSTKLCNLNKQLSQRPITNNFSLNFRGLQIELQKDPRNGQYCNITLTTEYKKNGRVQRNVLTRRLAKPEAMYVDSAAKFVYFKSKRKLIDNKGLLLKAPTRDFDGLMAKLQHQDFVDCIINIDACDETN